MIIKVRLYLDTPSKDCNLRLTFDAFHRTLSYDRSANIRMPELRFVENVYLVAMRNN